MFGYIQVGHGENMSVIDCMLVKVKDKKFMMQVKAIPGMLLCSIVWW